MVKSIKRSALGLLFTAMLLGLTALAANAASVNVNAAPDSLTAPGAVDVTVEVSNPGGWPLLDVELVADGAGQYIGDIQPGGSGSTTVSGYQVSRNQLEDGFSWNLQWFTEDGEQQSTSVPIPVKKKAGKPGMSLSVKADKEQYRSGDEAELTYRVTNTGELPLTNIVIQDGIASAPIAQGISLGAGESETKTHTLTVEKTVESEANAAGLAEGGADVSTKAKPLTVEVMETGLNILLSEVETGAGVTSVDILLVNNGNVDFENIVLTDDAGAVIADGLMLAEGEEAHIDHEVPNSEARELVVTADYVAGDVEDTLKAASAPLSLKPLYLPEDIKLTASVRVDKMELEEAGQVALQLILQNDNPIDLQNVVLKENMAGTLLSIPALPQGPSEHSATVNVLESRDLSFYVEYEDSEGRVYREDVPPVHIAVKVAEVVTSPVPLQEVGDNNIEMIILMIALAAILLVVIIAIVVLLVKRAKLAEAAADDREMLEEMVWSPSAPRRAVPREAVQELPSPESRQERPGERIQKEGVKPRTLQPRRSEGEDRGNNPRREEIRSENPRGGGSSSVKRVEREQKPGGKKQPRQGVAGRTTQPGRPSSPSRAAQDVGNPSAAAERARRESAQAQREAERRNRGDLSAVRPVQNEGRETRAEQDSAQRAARRLAEYKQQEGAQTKPANASDGRAARKRQEGIKQQSQGVVTPIQRDNPEPPYGDGYDDDFYEAFDLGQQAPDQGLASDQKLAPDGRPKVPNYVMDEKPVRTRDGAGVVPKKREGGSAPRRARPVEEQLSQEISPPASSRAERHGSGSEEQEDWTLFEEAFGVKKRPPAEVDDWTLFEENFLDDDDQR